jgi:glycine/D-amino acid oxidase-like deaminating enzyme
MTLDTKATLTRLGVGHEVLGPEELRRRYPQVAFEDGTWGLLEPESGVLMARRAVQAVVDDAVRRGCALRRAAVGPVALDVAGRLDRIRIEPGEAVAADTFVFACGPWLPKIFPSVLERRIVSTRQEVFFFGTPAGDPRFAPKLPWIDFRRDGLWPARSRRPRLSAPDRQPSLIDRAIGRCPRKAWRTSAVSSPRASRLWPGLLSSKRACASTRTRRAATS